ncbi:MAG: sulfur oxidation c-type cytochrome SoxA [Rhodospirillales bacterium]|nr:sulfur oxidation c-type cytochrome SoxA [Rhodospirillales bacterium]
MKIRNLILAFAALVLVGCTAENKGEMGQAEKRAADPRNAAKIAGDKSSGYVYMTAQTRDMQDDDFANPGFVWIDTGEGAWNKVEGKAGKACMSCHDIAKFKGVSNKYPKYDAASKKMVSLPHVINAEREKRMGAKPWKWESDEMMGMTAYINLQSRGMPVNVKIDGAAAPFFAKGKAFFEQKRGLMDLACASCHDANAGNMARSNVLSEAHVNGFPTYRMKWQKMGSLHRRFIGCNKNIRAEPYKRGSEEYTNLELYMMWRSAGLKWETPSVRN